MLTLPDERYGRILDAGTAAIDKSQLAEAALPFQAERAPTDAYLKVRAEVLRRWNYCCAVTDTQFASGEAPELRLVAIRPRERGGPLHAGNYLPMVERAERAWLTGGISVTDQYELVAVLDRLDPELLAAMPPDGKLIVPRDPALRPDPEHLAYHWTYVFGT
jgi:predicted restriction endonuclease